MREHQTIVFNISNSNLINNSGNPWLSKITLVDEDNNKTVISSLDTYSEELAEVSKRIIYNMPYVSNYGGGETSSRPFVGIALMPNANAYINNNR